MTSAIRFTPDPGTMNGLLSEVPAFPGECFSLNVPEGIGDASHASPSSTITVQWTPSGQDRWVCVGQRPGELEYVLTLATAPDVVDIHIALTNRSPRPWAESLAFTCFKSASAPSVADFECVRHWSRSAQQMRRLTELPREFGPRPTVQVYAVEGATPVAQIPLAASFAATPRVLLEGWLGIRSRDGTRLAAVASKPALFLFQNMEFSCIHSCPSFGALAPGETGEATTRIYLVQSPLAAWHRRMTAELGP
jgi:hypothetical protein